MKGMRGTVGLTLQIVSLLLVNFLPPTFKLTIASDAIAMVKCLTLLSECGSSNCPVAKRHESSRCFVTLGFGDDDGAQDRNRRVPKRFRVIVWSC